MKISVVLPVYNEEDNVGAVLQSVSSVILSSLPEPVDTEIIVVDDASTDRTAEIIARIPGIKLFRHEKNSGKGAAIRTGLAHVTGDIVLIQDADMEYSVEDYPGLLRPFMESDIQVVYGSRFLKRRWPRNMRWPNWLANRILTTLTNILYRAGLTDEATCFKVFRSGLIRSLPLRASGFDFCPEVTALVRLRNVEIKEVPIEYIGRTHAEGKKVRWTDALQAVKTLLAYRLRKGLK